MNPLIELKIQPSRFRLVLCLAWLGLVPLAEAVFPAPDGAYPGGNTAEGQAALLSLTTGTYNTAVGWLSLRSNTEGDFNTGVGAGALFSNTGNENTATGAGALLSNTTGTGNTAYGALALFSNTTGGFNTANGLNALFNNTAGIENTANGFEALFNNTGGDHNTADGAQALLINTTGEGNTATGYQALLSNMTGNANTADGVEALLSNTIGSNNTAIGFEALLSNTDGDENTANGAAALQNNIGGSFNTATGRFALINNVTGNFNIALGNFAGEGVTSANNVICIGAGGGNVSHSCFIGEIWSQPGGSQAVYVNSEGKLGAQVSARRFKDEIKLMEQASEVIYGLKPVTFRYKPEIEPTRPLGFGLIAEEVENISPDLVMRGSDGKANSVRYDAVNTMVLNEFLKEHEKVQEQQATIADLKLRMARQEKQIAALASGLQRVSAQIEMSKPVPQMAIENR